LNLIIIHNFDCCQMFTVHHHPQKISKYQLDQYLSQGWFRMGQSIFTCHFLYVHNNVYSTVWIRLNLHKHAWSKRQRKLVRRIESKFEVRVQKAVFDAEKDRLYERYKTRFKEQMAESIDMSLMNGVDTNIYDTYEVSIYDGGQLIAASFFDLGVKATASIMGIFDPDYEQFSLGHYTMLREIAFSIETGKDYYYPGYIVPGYARFDYKLRIGEVDYFSPETRSWKLFSQDNMDSLLSEQLKRKMKGVFERLQKRKIPVEMMFFPSPPMLFSLIDHVYINSPLCVLCHQEDNEDYPLMIDYDAKQNTFRLYRAGIVLKLLYESTDDTEVVEKIMKYY